MQVRALLRDLQRVGVGAVAIAVAAWVVVFAGIGVVGVRGSSTPAHLGPSGTKGWVRVADHKVGFVADLPQPPTDSELAPARVAGAAFTIRLATAGHRIVIERFASGDVAATALAQIFRNAIDSLASGAGFQVISERLTTFRGHSARLGSYVTDDGSSYEVMIFAVSADELYLIASPARYFAAITSSFQPLSPRSP
jgi:hypothetical protein